jgi:hypothetical protein
MPDDQEPKRADPQLLQILTTDHFVLQGCALPLPQKYSSRRS